MMEGLGKESSFCSSRPFQWFDHADNEAPSGWKLTDCFSSFEHTAPLSEKPKDYMESRKPVLELKDVPPPPPPLAVSKPFPLAPLPNPPSCLQSQQPDPLQQQQQPPPGSTKVRVCAHCEGSLQVHHGTDVQHNRAQGFGVGGGVSVHLSKPLDVPSSSSRLSCQAGSALHPPFPGVGVACAQDRGLGDCDGRLPSVATSQPLPSHQHLPCCTGLLRPPQSFPPLAASCSQAKLLPPAPSVPAPLHRGCLAPSGYYPCSVDYSTGARGDQHFPALGGLSSSHLCTNPLHLNVERTVCLKGTHYCRECLRKPVADAEKVWPNIPPLPSQSVAVPVPMCNGCGVPGASSDGMLLVGSNLGKPSQKHGSPESGGQENLPPVGVFWDIENCSVPSGRSAVAVVQRIRSRFFQGHREAEFICVCDISKESKEVIQELNNCQVTVAHINATAKNAADDKLRQSLRRFAETHTAPATVVLVSTDVNFASELSDLRHRHGFRVVLVHKTQASEALLQHAHQRVAFETFVSDLPPRTPAKQQPCSNLLYVYNLPTNRDGKSVGNRLRRLSDNCGGKVQSISAGAAVLRFGSQDAAERARKRMENEDVFGNRISVSFCPRPREAAGEAARLPAPSAFLPVEKPRSPRRAGRTARPCQVAERAPSPRKGGCAPRSLQDLCSLEPKAAFPLEKRSRGDQPSPQSNGEAAPPRSALAADAAYRGRRRDCSTPRSVSDSPMDRSVGEFQVSTPSAFSRISLQRTFSPLVLSQGSWSSRSGSPCLSNRSSPLSAPNRSPCPDSQPEPFSNGADIQVANMDYRMSRKELQQILHDAFSKHGRVKSVELSPYTDYQLRATVQMCSLPQAISAVSGLHRYKIGSKRIHVSLVTGANNKSLAMLSSEVMSILQDAPACCLPLFKLTEIYEKKSGHKLAVSDLYKLTEVVAVRDQGSSRLVCLLPSSQARQSPLGSSQSHDGSSASCSPVVFEELEYHEPVCKLHCAQHGFSESDFDPDSYKIPFVVLSLKAFAAQVHSLLQSHEGTVPLLSFPECYAAEFSALKLGEEGELEGAVPLEHLITCIPGINIVTAQNGFKIIKWIHNKPPPPNADPWVQRCKSPVGNPQLIQLSREIIDLMKSQPSCSMPISKFIPSYHHHFAKQCRVSDYGYSKLLELLEAVPHVLQILGMGSKRLLTLTHRAQVKRFTQDLLKLLKFQVSKQVVIRDFMQAYHWCFSRDWRVVEYGMCDLMDLLAEIPDTTITITQQDTDTLISIPKRERTPEEIDRTKQFAKEVVDLLRHQPHCRMSFSKFIPSYHHHFGRQCKLTYYGFTKLMELFEAIPEVLLVLECGEEKILTLTEVEKVKALAAQLVKLLRAQKDCSLPLGELLSEYSKTFGYGLRLQDFDVSSVPALLHKLRHVVKVVDGAEGRELQLINRKSMRSLTTQLLALLMSLPDGADSLSVEELSRRYEEAHGAPLNPCEYGFVSLSELLKSLPYLVELFESEQEGRGECVRLTRLYQFARSVRALLHTYHYHQIFLTEFSGAFSKYTGRGLQPRSYGYSTLEELLVAIPQVVWIKGHGHKKIIVLKNDMKARTSPNTGESPQPEGERSGSPSDAVELRAQSPGGSGTEAELLCLNSGSPVDLLCGPVPSCLPSPQLHPDPVLLQHADLIRFEEQPPAHTAESENADMASAAPDVCETSPGPKEPFPASVGETPPAPSELASAAKPPQPPALKASLTDSPSKRASRNRVKLAANFSRAPVTRL
ncbi:meiosis regulator and mRNA stability factor 1 isoform X1 [Anguilla anguilla]|uniref:meiosis regulator and mRNA stability factor 1 isoform X1 n=1 Tax=Anguilla anguilla TaxID=7936 RepID=UPI0015ACE4AD|nr:meiosis regulator and mRNA stability factor 1 isoform X1 [Anguilla anguilla]XP_035260104.1 meiosis regulator and mRNA stability factor 1 isoform X1 [Anguilla anguilla]XP_035260105.1 meiosis regulator and mRNA stability factor 1 isoform X1 [Anguilla anguilla]XP_035260106.1 meiosis regulator and mRNA stability factor 1 isoform X1 [Anguilla anguilla]